MTPLHDTNAEIVAGLRAHRDDLRRRQRRRAPLRRIDELVAELEELNLAGRQRVPEAMEARLLALEAALPADLRGELRARVTIGRLMDRLYGIQEEMLHRLGTAVDEESEHLPATG